MISQLCQVETQRIVHFGHNFLICCLHCPGLSFSVSCISAISQTMGVDKVIWKLLGNTTWLFLPRTKLSSLLSSEPRSYDYYIQGCSLCPTPTPDSWILISYALWKESVLMVQPESLLKMQPLYSKSSEEPPSLSGSLVVRSSTTSKVMTL